jgi:hypothetical protein
MEKFTNLLIVFILVVSHAKSQNNGLHFDGTDHVTINHGSNSLSGTFTIEFWAKPSSLGGQGFIGSRGPADGSFDIQLTGSGGLHGDIGNGSGWITTSADAPGAGLQVGVWSHIAYVITPNGYTIYVNAVQKGSGTYSGTPLAFDNSHILTLGTYGSNWGGTYNGAMDELRIWSTARTQAEILNNMNVELSSGTGLLAAYHFNQGTAGGNNSGVTTLTDAMGAYNGTLNTFALSGSTSNWVVGASPLLPVELTAFLAFSQKNTVLLTWQTATEINNKGFEVEHSTDGRNWKPIGFVPGNGNTLENHHYTFVHLDPIVSQNYYRLRQMDFDGKETVSKTVSVFFDNGIVTRPRLFPTVTEGLVTIKNDGEDVGKVTVFNAGGQSVMTLAGATQLDLSGLKAGVYFVQVKSANTIFTERIIRR